MGEGKFGVRSLRSGKLGGTGNCLRLGGTRNLELGTLNGRSADPYQHFAVFINRQFFNLDELRFQIFQSLVIKVEFALECAIRNPLPPPQKLTGLIDKFGKPHLARPILSSVSISCIYRFFFCFTTERWLLITE